MDTTISWFLIPCYQRAGVIVQNERKAVCSGTLLTVEQILPKAGLEFKTARSVGKHLTHRATGAPPLQPGHIVQSVGHLTHKSGFLGSLPGLATYFHFSFRFFKKGSCQLLAKICARCTG